MSTSRPDNAADTIGPDNSSSGLVTLPSAFGAAETVARLDKLLAEKGIRVFARFDHSGAAEEAGLPLRFTQVLVFGNPRAGTPLMQANQTIGIDLPLRALVWEDEAGRVWVSSAPRRGLEVSAREPPRNAHVYRLFMRPS